ncbi:MAG: GntR family transcriptional regulator [Bryobacteraceae bacterium]
MNPELPELKSLSIRDGVANVLRQALLKGQFGAGETLSEVTLSKLMKVSRGPVREALLVLAQEGLVTHAHNRGFAVLSLGEEDFRKIMQVRVPLESLSLALARGRIGRGEMEDLDACFRRMCNKLEAGDFPGTTREDLRFHELIWEACGNEWLVASLKRVLLPFFVFTMTFRQKQSILTPEILSAQHRMYLDYLRGATAASAEDCVRYHLSLYAEAGVPENVALSSA